MTKVIRELFYPGNIPTVIVIWAIIGATVGAIAAKTFNAEKLRYFFLIVPAFAIVSAIGIAYYYSHFYGPVEWMLATELIGSLGSTIAGGFAMGISFWAVTVTSEFMNWKRSGDTSVKILKPKRFKPAK